MEFANEFVGKFGRGVVKAVGKVEVFEINIGKDAFIWTNTIGSKTFMDLYDEIRNLRKAGNYKEGTIQFERLRPPGSKLPDSPPRKLPL